jgi:capsular exopolysaccharide synthesis family protein
LNNANSNKIYLVTSSISGEGKTYIAENLSITFAKTGKKVLLVGADLRKPKIYSDFGLDNSVGISTYMNSDIPLKDVIFSSKVDNLDVLISGPIPSNPSDIFLQDRFVKIFDNLKKIYDIIIIDTPPIGLVTDALNLMEYSDINLYVTRQSYTQKNLLGYVNDLYEKDRVANFHIVFNDVVDGGGAYAYGYGYGYGYGYTSDSDYFDNNNSVK